MCSLLTGCLTFGTVPTKLRTSYPFDAHCCHMGTAIKHPVPDRVKPSFVIIDIRALWRASECLLLLLVWHAPLGVRSAKRRHQSPEWTILSHSYRLIQWDIVWSQVLPDSLHPRSSRTSWWFPPVLRRGSSYDTPGICLVWHSCNMAEQRKTQCLDNSRQAGLPHSARDGTIWFLTAFADTMFEVTAQHTEPYRVPGCQKLQMTAYPCLTQDAL